MQNTRTVTDEELTAHLEVEPEVVQKLNKTCEELIPLMYSLCTDVIARQFWFRQNKVFMKMLETMHSLLGETLEEIKTVKTTEQTIN